MLLLQTVCTGNICRSPMGQVVLDRYVADAGLAGQVQVTSRGISDEEHGNPIDPRAARVLRAAGYDVPRHRATRVRADELARQDLVLAMTYGHYRALTRIAPPDGRARIAMYRSFDPHHLGEAPGPGLDIADPWYGGSADFEEVLDQLEAAAPAIVADVKELVSR